MHNFLPVHGGEGWGRVRVSLTVLSALLGREEMVCSAGVGGGPSCPLSLKAVGNLGRGGVLDDSSDYFGKCPVTQRKEWVEANLACERRENEVCT